MIKKTDKITFKKHKEKTIEETLKYNPTHIEWVLKIINKFCD